MLSPARVLALTVFATVTLLTGASARADLAPPDLCTAPGQPCMNAAPSYNGAGTCVTSSCTRSVPGDGGMTQMMYDCNLCKAGGADAATDGGGSKSDSGCTVGPGPRGPLTGDLVALAFVAVACGAWSGARSGRSNGSSRSSRDRRRP